MDKSSKINIIIPNYNGKTFLKECLDSIKTQNYPNYDITIIDNASEDGSVEFIKKNYPEINLIKKNTNIGFAAAVNLGINNSSADYILILNNDTQLDVKCILNLYKCIKNENSIFAVTSKMIQYHDHSKMDDAGDEYSLMGWTKRVGYGKSPDKYNKKRETFSACAGASLYRKTILDKIGYFDENFFAYLEDVDISYRARIYGYKCIYCPEAIVYHVGSASSGSRYNEFKIRLATRNNVYIAYKNMPWPQLIFNFIFILIGFFIKYIFFIRKGYGHIYIKSLKEGFNTLNRINKVEYENVNLYNYLKIEWLLIKNALKFFFF
ncbi:MAG: glycosyltransferase family 2 protein [Methanobacteriaceae archaeon]|nr:glycosyltransferase family 2 protein [Methanobacteriaceae archaeon]